MATTNSSAAPVALERSNSSRRHHHSSTSSSSAPTRSQSTRVRSSVPANPVPPPSSHNRTSSRHGALDENVRPANYEQSNAAAQGHRRSSSKDRPPPSRSESHRSGGHHSRHHSRQPSDMATTAANAGVAPVVNPNDAARHSRPSRPRTSIPAQSGDWILGKTIGAGSMGKVKLARKAEGGEQVAVKIVPRGVTDDGHQHQSRADRERAEHSKEVRTAREAAIVTLLDHPYICGMRDVVRTTYHWYMLFEYVNGGQMLDYIISHGRLKEKQARKFSRQIASALDYCHRNSIAHRDLKIENILISKTGDIKIIDFGLSNLFSPRSHLKTFCGSLYFAAPELLQAKAYTGPEVDVWSFGIVLYVLVCGKVPFDDQSMPALHAKIKKGVVDYPNWLSPECKNLISRMLVTDPRQRASLQEIMTHPWMIKGFGAPPENYLPVRDPITMPLDPKVIQAMTGFDFGPPEDIERQLTEVVQSQDYMRAVKVAAHEKEHMAPVRDAEKKRGVFDFYKRRNSATSRDTLSGPSTEALALGNDPINAYNPLISVYYLVREKQERDRNVNNPGATSMPREKGEAPLKLPEAVVAPKPAYTNATAYEMAGEKPTGGRSRPRARTHGEDEIAEGVKNIKIANSGPASPAIFEPPPEPVKKESTATSLLRRFSTRRKKESSDRSHPPMVTVQSPNESGGLRKSFSVRRARDRSADNVPALPRAGSSQPQHSDLLSPPPKSSSKVLGRSASVASGDNRRRSSRREDVETNPPRMTYKENREPPPTSGSDHSTSNEKAPTSRDGDKHLNPNTAMRTKSLGHARRESIQARRARREEAREEAREANVPEETDAELDASGVSTERVDRAENVKPVFLKGLFSVSTTSTKPVTAIRADIIRVLKQLGVDYTEIRSGFRCRHTPSIDLKKVQDERQQPLTPGHKRRISFGGFMSGSKDTATDREDYSPRTPKRSGHHDTSYTNSDASDDSVHRHGQGRGGRAAGETMTHVQSDLGGSMVLEFEILIVKVPLLSFHGIQFKRLAGGTWQYKNMADQILRELRL